MYCAVQTLHARVRHSVIVRLPSKLAYKSEAEQSLNKLNASGTFTRVPLHLQTLSFIGPTRSKTFRIDNLACISTLST
jgi:hypothetical protein